MRATSAPSIARSPQPTARSPLVSRGAQKQADQIARAVLAQVGATGFTAGSVDFDTKLAARDPRQWLPRFRAEVLPLLERVGIRASFLGIERPLDFSTVPVRSLETLVLSFDVDVKQVARTPAYAEAAAAAAAAVAQTTAIAADAIRKAQGRHAKLTPQTGRVATWRPPQDEVTNPIGWCAAFKDAARNLRKEHINATLLPYSWGNDRVVLRFAFGPT